jgi:hypothetical protein
LWNCVDNQPLHPDIQKTIQIKNILLSISTSLEHVRGLLHLFGQKLVQKITVNSMKFSTHLFQGGIKDACSNT